MSVFKRTGVVLFICSDTHIHICSYMGLGAKHTKCDKLTPPLMYLPSMRFLHPFVGFVF